MPLIEAIADNVRYSQNKFGDLRYYPKCHVCGAEVFTWSYIHGKKYTCKDCKEVERRTAQEVKRQQDLEARREKLDRAIARIEKCDDIRKYESAIHDVVIMIENGGHIFDSTEEVMVALVLLKNDIPFRHQVRFGTRYVADFVLDDMKVVLEVDGDIFHNDDRVIRQQTRDALIIATLGPSWELIRMKTSDINKNVKKLPAAIRAVVKRRQMYRRNNKGQLPEWYKAEG